MRKFAWWLPVLALLHPLSVSAAATGNQRVADFSKAKKLAAKIHEESPFTLYCGCRYSGKKVDFESCGYKPRKNKPASARLEWEHVVPAEAFGQSFPEWREGAPECKRRGRKYKGRKCAEKTNQLFSRMAADLYNLWPEIAELNRLRSNYSMAMLGGSAKNPATASFGGCQAVLSERKFEPMDRAKGIVARVYMYMGQAYPGRGIISEKNELLFVAWDKLFPVTEWECRRAEKILAVQGNENPVLKERCGAMAAKK
jgi:deoxyribonuclease-1